MVLTTAEQVLALIEKYGLSTVLLILLIIGLILWLKPKMDAIWSEYATARETRETIASRKKAITVDAILVHDLKIKGVLDGMLIYLECDWVQLWQFHNGVYSMGHDMPFLYCSITHESWSDNVTPMSMVYRSLPTTFFRKSAEKFEKEDLIETTLGEQSNDIARTFALGALTNCLLPIRGEDGNLAALLSVGWAKVHNVTEEQKVEMKIGARRCAITLGTALAEMYVAKEAETNALRE
jgi:hypothetical protein